MESDDQPEVKMLKVLTKKYANVTRDIVELFKSFCSECMKKRKRTAIKGVVVRPILTKDYGSRGQVDLVDMQSMPIATSCFKSYERDPSLITSIRCKARVRGVAVVGTEIFVAVKSSPEIKVHNTDTYSLQTSIKVPGLSDTWDMVADDSSLFVSEYSNSNIHRIKLPGKRTITGWQAAGNQNGLSMTKHGSVLVTCYWLNKLFEYSTDGTNIREIVLQSDIRGPCRAIQLDNGQFLIDHDDDSLHRVCLIDNKGKLIKSFGGTTGTKGGPLKYPRQMVLDQNGFIFVADRDNSRVVLLDSNLEFVKDLIPASAGMKRVFAVCLEKQCGRLYVSDFDNNKLAVFQL